MNLQEALFLSSLSKAEYRCPVSGDKEYLVQVEIKDHQTLMGNIIDSFEITVSRVVDDKVFAPHVTTTQYSLEDCIEYLQRWRIGERYEEPWQPVEQWDEGLESAPDVIGEPEDEEYEYCPADCDCAREAREEGAQ